MAIYSKTTKLKAFAFEQAFRDHLSEKYTSYITSSSDYELNILAKLVDIRSDDESKYSNLTVRACFTYVKQELE